MNPARTTIAAALAAAAVLTGCGRSGTPRLGLLKCHEMTRYLISFDDGAMTFPEQDLPDVP